MQESDLQRASKILRTEFGSDWKQIVQTLGTRELTHCVGQDLTSFMAFPERAEGGSNQWRGKETRAFKKVGRCFSKETV